MGRNKLNITCKKYCLNCGNLLKLNNNRDIERKNFCNHSCSTKYCLSNGIIGMVGKKHSEFSKEKMKTDRKDVSGINNPMFGLKRPEVGIKVKEMWKNKELEHIRENMIKSNPMKNKEVVEKMKITKFKKIESKVPKNINQLYLEKKYSLSDIAKMCGLSANAVYYFLKRNNVQIRPDMFFRRGRKFLCDDGHIADSSFERNVDNWLFYHNIPHAIHHKVFPDRKITADFKVGDVLIECDGLMSSRPNNYFVEKLELYKKHNINFIIININENINTKLTLLIERDKYIQKKLDYIIGGTNGKIL